MSHDAGMEFMLPLGRCKRYGGVTDHNGSNFETLTWATGFLASAQHTMTFGTVHVPLIQPGSRRQAYGNGRPHLPGAVRPQRRMRMEQRRVRHFRNQASSERGTIRPMARVDQHQQTCLVQYWTLRLHLQVRKSTIWMLFLAIPLE